MAAQLNLTDSQKQLIQWMASAQERERLPFIDVTAHDTRGGDLELMHPAVEGGFVCYRVDLYELIDKELVAEMPDKQFRVTNLGIRAVAAEMI